jgi:hypothetical protein
MFAETATAGNLMCINILFRYLGFQPDPKYWLLIVAEHIEQNLIVVDKKKHAGNLLQTTLVAELLAEDTRFITYNI